MNLNIKYKIFCLLHCFLLIQLTESERKSKRAKEFKTGLPSYDIFTSDRLPSDLQVTTFLYKEQPKLFFYSSTMYNGPLSITITACSSTVHWYFTYTQDNYTDATVLKEDLTITSAFDTKHFLSRQGLYVLKMLSKERDTYVHMYVSTEPGGSQALQNARFQHVRFIKKQRRKRLTLKWEPSMVDPQGTDYCLVISRRKNYASLCSAQSDGYGINFPKSTQIPVAASQTVINWRPIEKNTDTPDPSIVCLQRKTSYTLSNLKHGEEYFFDIFAVNKQSNLTYPFGTSHIIFDKRIKPIILKDSRSTFANLKKLDGKAVFKFKVSRNSGSSLELFVVPCDGTVDVEVFLNGKLIATKRRIFGFGALRITSPVPKGRYYIKIFAVSRGELRRSSGVEVYATSKSSPHIPIPRMPQEPIVNEYESLRTCTSVTIGWFPTVGQKSAHYCFVIREGEVREMENYEMPNQCGLDKRLRKSADFALKYCKTIKHENERVLTEKIKQLNPGKNYIVQVTVKKPKGKALSYNLLQVHTLPSCHRNHYDNET